MVYYLIKKNLYVFRACKPLALGLRNRQKNTQKQDVQPYFVISYNKQSSKKMIFTFNQNVANLKVCNPFFAIPQGVHYGLRYVSGEHFGTWAKIYIFNYVIF